MSVAAAVVDGETEAEGDKRAEVDAEGDSVLPVDRVGGIVPETDVVDAADALADAHSEEEPVGGPDGDGDADVDSVA